MINTSTLGILVYMHTLTAHIMYNLKYRLEPYLCKLSTSNIIYLSKFKCRSSYLPVSKVYKHTATYDIKYNEMYARRTRSFFPEQECDSVTVLV